MISAGRFALVVVLIVGMLPLQSARAGDRIFMSGGEVSDTDFYTYLGLMLPGPGWKQGKGLFQRYWLDRFGYEYEGGPGNVEARVWGGEAALGYVSPTSHGWWSASLGLRYTDTSLSPDDRGASARGEQFSPKLQLEGDTEIAPDWRLGAIASYTLEQNQYWGRMRVMHHLASSWSAGAEATANGNDEMNSIGTGMVVIWHPHNTPWALGLKTGYRFQDHHDGTYGSFELSRAF